MPASSATAAPRWALACLAAALGCVHVGAPPDAGPADGPADGGPWVLRGATVLNAGQPPLQADVTIQGGLVVAVGLASAGLPGLDAGGAWVVPAFVDSHVHLALRPQAVVLARAGVAAAVDMASPTFLLASPPPPLQLKGSGPMLTAPGGYPTQSWGRFGYGLELDGGAAAVAAVDELAARGASHVKLAFGELGPALAPEVVGAIVARAHQRGLLVAAHALSRAAALEAARAGADVLAHTPLEPLDAEAVRAWQGRTVVSTLFAFGGGAGALGNLAALRDGGVQVLYGTDFGNGSVGGLDVRELLLLQRAGLDGEALLAAGTSAPARTWGFQGLGQVAVGSRASFLVLEADPRHDVTALAAPTWVFLDGVAR